jgi:hypothetical protein
MRERPALNKLRTIAATQMALLLASEATLAHAIATERDRDSEVGEAETRLDEAIEDWRDALALGPVDAALLPLFAQAPPRRQDELDKAKAAQLKAQLHTNTQRLRHGENAARLRRTVSLKKRTQKRLRRKQEEKALAALEHRTIGAAP